MTAHTPGPWTVKPDFKGLPSTEVIGLNGRIIANTDGYGETLIEEKANARLIAAAPELYSLLSECKEFSNYDVPLEWFNRVSKALAKVTT